MGEYEPRPDVCDPMSPRWPDPKSLMLPLMAPLRWLLLPLPVSTEVMLETKLLKQGLWSRDGDGEDLDSWELGESCRLGGEEEELRRLEDLRNQELQKRKQIEMRCVCSHPPYRTALAC